MTAGERKSSGSLPLPALLSLAFFIFIFVIPLLYTISGANLSEAAQLLATPTIQKVIWNTVFQAILSTAPAVLLALPVAWVLARYRFTGGKIVRAIILVPFFMPAFAFAEVVSMMFGRSGIINQMLMQIFALSQPPIQIMYSMNAVIFAHIIYYTPLAIFLLEPAFASLDEDLLDAAQVLGASRLKTFRKVILHGITPALAATVILVFIYSFLTFSTPLLIGGTFTTFEVEMYYYWSKFGEWTKASSLALIQLSFNALFILATLWVRERFFREKKLGKAGMLERIGLRLRSPLSWLLMAIVTIVFVMEAVPVYLVLTSGFVSAYRYLLPVGFSLTNFGSLDAYAAERYGISFTASLSISVAIAIFTTVLTITAALLTAHALRQAKGVLRTILGVITSIPLAVSTIAMVLGLLGAYGFGLLSWYGTWQLIAIAHIFYTYPLATRMIESALLTVDPDLVDASLSLGASRFLTFFRLELPLIFKVLAAAALLVFSASLAEFTYAYSFSVVGMYTAPAIIGRLLDAPIPELGIAAAATSILMLLVLFTSLIGNSIAGRRVF